MIAINEKYFALPMKNSVQFILSLVFLSVFNWIHAQVAPSIEWQECLGGSDNDILYSFQQTVDKGFIAAGGSASNDGNVSGNH